MGPRGRARGRGRRRGRIEPPSWEAAPDLGSIVPDDHGPEADRLLRQALGRHMILGEAALVAAWVLFSVVVFHFLTTNHPTGATVTLAWLFVGGSFVMVLVILLFRRVAERRIRLGLHDAAVALRSIQSVTDPALSFLPLDALLDELLARTGEVVGGDVATIFLVTGDGTSLTVRASAGLDEHTEGLLVRVGEGVVGEVAARAEAVIVNDVAAVPTAPVLRERVASMLAAPLLVGDSVIGVVQVGTRVRHRFDARDLQLLQLVADRCGASIERARLDEAERRSRLGAEHARQHVALLARAGDVLATALESYDEAMVRLVDVVVPSFADWFAVDVVDEEGSLRRVAHGGQGRWEADPGRHPHPDGEALVHRVLATGRPEVVLRTGRQGPPHGGEPAVPGAYEEPSLGLGIESMFVVPVHLRGLSFGALSFATGIGRRGYRRSDLETARGLAERVAIAVERVLLWSESRHAELAATRHAAQLRRLMEAALAVNAPLAESQVLRVLSEHARRVLDAEQAVVVVLPPGMEAVGADEAEPRVEVMAPRHMADSASAVVEAACRAVVQANRPLRQGGPSDVPDPAVAVADVSAGARAVPWMGVPLVDSTGAHPRAIVVLGRDRAFNAEDESVLVLLAQMATVALDNARLYQAVQGNEQRLQAVVESSPLAIAELGLDGSARWWNRAAGALLSWDGPGDGERRVPAAGETAATSLAWLWDRTRHGEATVGLQVGAVRDDEVRELSVSTAPLLDHEGMVTGILAVAEDVTERQRMLEQFQQAERLGAMARMAGGVAHDFNNLLTVILGCSEILLRRMDEADPLAAEVQAIERAGQRAAALTSQLLAIGHRQVGQPEVVDPDAVVGAMEPMLLRVMGEDVQLEVVPADPPGRILADPAELERAILNMAINARDAMPKGGRLVVRTRVVGTDQPLAQRIVALAVSDTGTGMDAETAEHCFEPFYTTKGMAKGTGLGLAAVHGMVTQAGGQVSVDTAPGRGTTITMWFPAVEDEAEALVAAPGDDSGEEGDELVLVVEDEDELRRLAVRALEERGYLVLAAAHGAEALAVTGSLERPVDLLVTDVVMPEMSGVELAEALAGRWPSLAVLFMSGHLDEHAMARHPLDPDADLLAKPFTPAQLGRRVRHALDVAATQRARAPELRARATGT
ncbi:MAG TPA: GAF domain-containing protein [Acidimicrobiales bacterium]|nr:GAF domain-containing protein [Acidimicrobiales bacterium]